MITYVKSMQAVGLQPRPRDLPETYNPRALMHQAARLVDSLACTSTSGDEQVQREQIARLKSEAEWLLKEHFGHTEALPECPRALRRMLLAMADLVDDDEGQGKGKGKKGECKGKGKR